MAYYSATTMICLITLVILSILVYENARIPRADKWLFYLTYAMLALAIGFEWLGVRLNGDATHPVWMLRVVKCGDYIFTPAIGGMMAAQLRLRDKWYRAIQAAVLLNVLIQLVSLFTGWMLVVDENHFYSHGPLYPLYEALFFLVIALFVIESIQYGRNYRNQNRISIFAIAVFAVLGILVQEMMGIRTSYAAVTIGATLLFIHITEYSQLESDEKIRDREVQILLSQIQPHFLFNCLSAIRETYYHDAKAGDRAITDLSDYLRHSIDSMTRDEMIPLQQELEHVSSYLNLQKLRFGNELEVQYELSCTDFKIPTLTLQPLVENAVSHGARKRADRRGVVTILSQGYDDRVEVNVIDNGPGFRPDQLTDDSDHPHVGLKNVRARLQKSCGGELKITSAPGQGTTATIVLPK